MVDLHSHILPGLDDGPEDLSASVTMAEAAAGAGIDTIVATPHVDHLYDVTPDDVERGVAELSDELRARGVELTVLPGGELAPSRIGELGASERRRLRLGGGPYLLVECPFSALIEPFEELVAGLLEEGEAVVLAHPERSPALREDLVPLERMVRGGALACLTAGSFRGDFGGPVRALAIRMFNRGLCHAVASDAHDHWRRPPVLDLGPAAPVDEETRRRLTDTTPRALVEARLERDAAVSEP